LRACFVVAVASSRQWLRPVKAALDGGSGLGRTWTGRPPGLDVGLTPKPGPSARGGAGRTADEGSVVGMVDQSLSEQAREAVLRAIIKSAPTVGNSPAGIRDLAEAYALLERNLVPNAGVVQTRT
jgi:hypothetical protein